MLGLSLSLLHKGASAPAVPWTPSQINTHVWLDASIEDSITKDESDIVSAWADQSGKNNHAEQSVEGRRPSYVATGLNGLPMVKGDNLLRRLEGPFVYACNNSFHIFKVLSKFEANDFVYDFTESSNIRCYNSQVFVYRYISGAAATDSISVPVETNPFMFYAAYINSKVATNNEFELYKNGNTSQVTGYPGHSTAPAFTDQSFSNYYILDDSNNNNALDGGIGEMIIIVGDITTDIRQRIEGYLAHKWLLTDLLPVDHPYKSTIPVV